MSASILLGCMMVVILGLGSPNIVESNDDESKFYELKQGNLSITFSNFGARIVSLSYPDKHGNLADVVLGHDTIKEYMIDRHNLGSIVGRVTGVIEGAEFTLNGTRYSISPNFGKNAFNGGHLGFSYMVWKMTNLKKEKSRSEITFTYNSYDGEQGFPGNLTIAVKYTIEATRLITEIHAETLNKATPVNIGQHVLWNLRGHNSGKALGHDVQIFGSKVVEVEPVHFIPSGKLLPVQGTPFDFLQPHVLGSRIKKDGFGYRINYVLNGGSGLKLAAILHEGKSGRILKLWTTQPTVLFVSSTQLRDIGKGGFLYQSYYACGFDPHGYPDFLHHPNFPSSIVTKGKPYKQTTIYEFSVDA